MKKSTVFLFGVLLIGLGALDVFARQSAVSVSSTSTSTMTNFQHWKSSKTNFQHWKSSNHNNQLTAEMWDKVLDGLSQMQQDIGELQPGSGTSTTPSAGVSIPKGAIMAFDLPQCPEGWERWDKASERVLVGANEKPEYERKRINGKRKTIYNLYFFGKTGGNDKIKLTEDQLPPHFHYMFGGNMGRDLASIWDYPELYAVDSYTRGRAKNGGLYLIRATENKPKSGRTSTVGNGKSIDILNPYVVVTYCKKK